MATQTKASNAHSSSHEAKGEWRQTRPGERWLIRVSGVETAGAYSVIEIVSSPGDSTPKHDHQNEDEHILVVEGTGRNAYGDKISDAAAGTVVTLTRNIPHAWGNATESALRVKITATTGGGEEALRVIARGGDIDLNTLSENFGIRIVGPQLLPGATQVRIDLPNVIREVSGHNPRRIWPMRSRP
jgi:quercetin dioxygenase-like cupin family protein